MVPATIVAAISSALVEAGALPPAIDVQLVGAIAKTPLGKAPLIKAGKTTPIVSAHNTVESRSY
jgi:hypothetical protein